MLRFVINTIRMFFVLVALTFATQLQGKGAICEGRHELLPTFFSSRILIQDISTLEITTEGWKPFLFQGKWGYKNSDGGVALEPFLAYDFCLPFYEGRARVQKNGYYYFIDGAGSKIREESFDEAFDFANGVAAVKDFKSNKWMYIDKSGKYKFYEQYDFAYSFLNEIAIVKKADQLFFIDKTGKKVIDRGFEQAQQFQNGYAIVKENGAPGLIYIDHFGLKAFAGVFRYAYPFEGGLAVVADTLNNWFTIDEKGDHIRSLSYRLKTLWNGDNNTEKLFVDGLACAYDTLSKRYFYVNWDFEKASPEYQFASAFNEHGVAIVRDLDGKVMYINNTFSNIYGQSFIDGYLWYRDGLFTSVRTSDSLYKYFNFNGEFVKGLSSKRALSFSCGFAISNNGLESWFVNFKGDKVYGPYQWASSFASPEGLAPVQDLESNCYFIDRLGVKHGQYSKWTDIGGFNKGYAPVGDGTSQYFVDGSLTKVFNQSFERAGTFNRYGYAKVRMNELWGLIDTNGKLVIPYKYEKETDCPNEPPK